MLFSKHKVALATVDFVAILAGFNLGFWYVFGSGLYKVFSQYPVYYVPSIILAEVIFLSVFQLAGLYKYQSITNPFHQIQTLLQCYAKILAAFVVIIFFIKSEYLADSRLTIALSFLFSFIIMVVLRTAFIPRIFVWMVKSGYIRKNTLIIGAGEHGAMVCRFLRKSGTGYFDIIGFCDDDFEKGGSVVEGFPVLGTSYDLESLVQRHRIKEIIIAISNIKRGVMLDLIDRCKAVGLVIHVVSDLYADVNEKMEAEEFGGLRTYRLEHRDVGIVRLAGKRMLDVVGAGLLLTVLSPLFLLIAWAIKRDSKGHVFYLSDVVGKGGKPFVAYKFRSMYDETNGGTVSQETCSECFVEEGRKQHTQFMKDFIQGNCDDETCVKDESRITRVGRLLRKYSLDELPQLINVFRGKMSLVGPRFCTMTEYRFYKDWHKRRFEVKPGMTGPWQVRARSAVSYDDMVILDIYYVENWSLFFDIEILLRTIPVVLFGIGSRIEKVKEKTLAEKIEEMERSTDSAD